MANLKEVRERIASVNNTQQITKAMKMVSAAKLRRAQGAIQQMRPYSMKLNSMLSNILSSLEGDASSAFSQVRTVEKACIVLVTSNRGLCGGFNSSLIKEAIVQIEGKYADVRKKGGLTVLCIGKKGYDAIRRRYADLNIPAEYVNLFENLAFDNTSKVADGLMTAFESREYDAVEVIYSRFRNAAVQFVTVEPFLPVAKMESTPGASTSKADYTFEPSKEELLTTLVPSILRTQFQKCLLDTHASEHGARMTAMDKATENADDLLKGLRISYNKARQEVITNQLMEISAGAAAAG